MNDDKSRGDYERRKLRATERSREQTTAGKEVGPIPEVANPARKEICRTSLLAFCETYIAGRFFLAWSADQLKVISKLERAILHGGLFALAMPRGSGKTTLTEAGALWSLLYGHRRFVVLIGATDKHAVEMMDSIKSAVETIDLIADDFPEVVHPIRCLEGINQRATGQTVSGTRTRITWTDNEAVLPTVAGSVASGARLYVASMTGRIRGIKAATPDGKTIRPDFAIADDPQTDDSAVSLTTIDKYERRLKGAVKGLAGPGKTIAIVVPCTVIAPRDLSDRLLDRDRNPQFQGERMRAVYAFPTATDLWDEYADLRANSLRNDGDGTPATEFYRANREAMDAGAVVAWPERFDPACEESALQSLMNARIDSRSAFYAEYQNEPEEDAKTAGAKELRPAEVVKRLSGLPRYEVPREAARLTAFIDVGGELHWFAVVAWDSAFGGAVVDYGAWPRQSRAMFAANDPRPGLSSVHAGMPETARVYAGLSGLTTEILSRTYIREQGGGDLRVERCLIDAGWNSQTVYQFARQSPFAGVIYPSKGIGRTATARGVGEWKPRPGERSGHHWRLTISETGRGQMVQFDPDAWKTRLYEMLTAPLGSKGCLTFYGREARTHELIGEHVAAESSEPVTLRGAIFDKWQIRPHRPDNHLLDCLTGCAVAASVTGLTWSAASAAGMPEPERKARVKVKLSELYRQKNG